MSALTNKVILIVSPQAWGNMQVSKHHYATELANYGNKVYFLNPPDSKKFKSIVINKSQLVENLFTIDHSLWFPYNIKFHAIGLFHLLIKSHIKSIVKKISVPIDIVWSFDLGNIYPFAFFPKRSLKIFHPVDEPLNKTAIDSAAGAQVIFSVTNEILNKYARFEVPSFFINHGVADIFLGQAIDTQTPAITRIGLSGNLLRQDMDRVTLLKIVKDNPVCCFEFWGSYKIHDANLGGEEDNETREFIKNLSVINNVKLHGAVTTSELAKGLSRMDAFLIIYDINKDQSKGTNYHKVMEYLAIGKVIISNNITTYQNKDCLVLMPASRSNNNDLPALFKSVVGSLQQHNSEEKIAIRRAYAGENTYASQIRRIEEVLSQIKMDNDGNA